MDKKNILEIGLIIILVIVLGIIIGLYVNSKSSNTLNTNIPDRSGKFMMEENKTKETTANDVDTGETVNSKEINLSEYNSNLTISEAGTYTLSGSFTHSVIVKATGDVTLQVQILQQLQMEIQVLLQLNLQIIQ